MKTKDRCQRIEDSYFRAREAYAEWGVDTEKALERLSKVAISIHCWQGDDVGGFEGAAGLSDGGLAVTGNYPGKARNATELRDDLKQAYSLVPGKHRLNLHAIYAETGGGKVERDAILPEHFSAWTDWARELGIAMDFNPTCFSHPKAASGFTLSSRDEAVRRFWIDHCIACRRIGEYFGKQLGSPCVTNIWIPDGFKDLPADRATPRAILKDSLDRIYAEKTDPIYNLDSVEPKLFGIGSESYVVGSHEFYLGYAVANRKLLCLDSGHFHPTETVSDKLSAVLLFLDRALLHVSRGVRWDSDHVVILSDELQAIAQELVRGDYLGRVHIGLDYFDASINRVAAWVIGARAMLKALLNAMLEPISALVKHETAGDYTSRLAMMEESKNLPSSAVWNRHCLNMGVPSGMEWMKAVKEYERTVLSKRRCAK